MSNQPNDATHRAWRRKRIAELRAFSDAAIRHHAAAIDTRSGNPNHKEVARLHALVARATNDLWSLQREVIDIDASIEKMLTSDKKHVALPSGNFRYVFPHPGQYLLLEN